MNGSSLQMTQIAKSIGQTTMTEWIDQVHLKSIFTKKGEEPLDYRS